MQNIIKRHLQENDDTKKIIPITYIKYLHMKEKQIEYKNWSDKITQFFFRKISNFVFNKK